MVYLPCGLQCGDYTVGTAIGEGHGGTVFTASRNGHPLEAATNAVKYPTNDREVDTLRCLHVNSPPCLGVPSLRASGVYEGKLWMVIDLLGAPLHKLMGHTMVHIWKHRAPQRWKYIRVLGRLLLRRLQAIHERGFVHCDIQPDNIMIGRVSGGPKERWNPFFIDFGLAHQFPGGKPIQPHAGTIEYNSIRSTDGGVRLPRDDVEALGWVLCYFVTGDLPWFSDIKKVNWANKPQRALLCKRVQHAKIQLLTPGGKDSFESWVSDVPPEMAEYLRHCRRFGGDGDEGEAARPDYDALARFLGGERLGGIEAEIADLKAFRHLCEDGVDEEPPRAVGTLSPEIDGAYSIVGSWNDWRGQEMGRDPREPACLRFELRLARDGAEFQIIRNGSWEQTFYPSQKHAGGAAANPVMGPGGKSHGVNWFLDGAAGDVVAVEFRRELVRGLDTKRISWRTLRHVAPSTTRPPCASYVVVGSWDNWGGKLEMAWSGACCRAEVQLGGRGRDDFQLLENGDWHRKLFPNVKGASPHMRHTLLGPKKHGNGKNWTIGEHPRDRSRPGAKYEVRLFLADGEPNRVEWSQVPGAGDRAGKAAPCAGSGGRPG